MSTVTVSVDPGICGLMSRIEVVSEDMMSAHVAIESDCPDIRKLGEHIGEIDSMKDVFAKLGDSSVYRLGNEFCRHGTCPVPGAILKGVEAACGLALPKDVHIEIRKKD